MEGTVNGTEVLGKDGKEQRGGEMRKKENGERGVGWEGMLRGRRP